MTREKSLPQALRPPQAEPSESRPASLASDGAARSLAERVVPSELRDLVVFVDGRAHNEGTLEFAAALAEDHEARLTGVFIRPAPRFSEAETFVRGTGMGDAIEVAYERMRSAEAERRGQFEALVRRHAVPWEWRSVSSPLAGALAVHARYADLAMVAREDPSDERVGPPGLVESLVLTSGRPIVVLPPRCSTTHLRRVLVGWNASREATHAIAAAMPLLVRAEAVEVLVVDRKGDAPRHGEEPGADIAQHLARHGARVEAHRLSARDEDTGHVLLSRAHTFDADLVVMGAYGHSRLSEWAFGGVTRTALLQAMLPILMSR